MECQLLDMGLEHQNQSARLVPNLALQIAKTIIINPPVKARKVVIGVLINPVLVGVKTLHAQAK